MAFDVVVSAFALPLPSACRSVGGKEIVIPRHTHRIIGRDKTCGTILCGTFARCIWNMCKTCKSLQVEARGRC
ncbi:hypothetical protein PISMIDRAFT_181949 [Pisolithus microcarpus 441]|uniref:Uncharacterized protein n=1 Tax=Pisolithus microcarpus 441 TaxID=765257 RepID=A0A0C9YPR9_9AGAM|nr:hypothetical protein BKA83DRAFT_181949 [Pisolithus microcarpus]KIK18616.1 hypothetical protein PISMIDRAFT_181949 [Pisolithus microcarpus 441]